MLLSIYFGTTVASWIGMGVCVASCLKRFKREGYTTVKNDDPVGVMIRKVLKMVLEMSIPVFNFFVAAAGLAFLDLIYERVKIEMISEGRLRRVNDDYMNADEIGEAESFDMKNEKTNTVTFENARSDAIPPLVIDTNVERTNNAPVLKRTRDYRNREI